MTTDQLAPPLARTAHKYLEPVHTHIYFVPEAGEHYGAAGVTGGMRGYFASRSAPLGVVPAEVVIATFYNFSPTLVRKAIPSVWETTTPEAMVAARFAAVDAALTRLLGDDVVRSDEMTEAAALAREATTACRVEGRPLFAGHAALPWPEPAHLQLWHATSLLREHRGDGHIAALVLAGLTGLEASVSYTAMGHGFPEEMQRKTRGYTEEEWEQVKVSLRDKGILAADGTLTERGLAQRTQLEEQTDVAAAAPYDHLGPERTQRLIDLVRPWARSISKQIFG
jgi:hypothetical protein